MTGRRGHHVPGAVVLAEELAHVLGGHRPDRFLAPEHFSAEWMIGEEGGRALLRRLLGRLVGVHEDLVEDHLAFGVEVRGAQRRLPHDVREQFETEVEALGEQPDVEGGVLLRGVGVEVTADLVDGLGDRGGRAVGGAFEEQMLEKVGRAPPSPITSSREPVPTQNPIDTERASSIRSVTSERPESRTSVVIMADPGRSRSAGPARSPTGWPGDRPVGAVNAAGDHPGRRPRTAGSRPRRPQARGRRTPPRAPLRRRPRRRPPRPEHRSEPPDWSHGPRSRDRRLRYCCPATTVSATATATLRSAAVGPRVARGGLTGKGERDLPLRIDVVDPDLDRLAELEDVLDPLDPLAASRSSRCAGDRRVRGGC